MEVKYEIFKETKDGYEAYCIADEAKVGYVFSYVPWKTCFGWNDELYYSLCSLEREPNRNIDFNLKIDIKVCREEESSYHYEVNYKDMCYVVAKAYTNMIKIMAS